MSRNKIFCSSGARTVPVRRAVVMSDFFGCGDCITAFSEEKDSAPVGEHRPPRVGSVGFDDVATDLIADGDRFRKGDEGIEVDEGKAAQCYLRAAEQGSAIGAHKLAWMFANGKGVQSLRALYLLSLSSRPSTARAPPGSRSASTFTVPAARARCQESRRETRDLLL